jgi:hypothetical protein
MLGKQFFAGVCVLFIGAMAVAQNVQIVSSRATASPDAKRSAVVDHILKVEDGEADPNSGGMVLRVTDKSTSSVTRQTYVEGTQVRVLQPPVWLDDNWCAYTYNIAKNANGMVYLNTQSGEGYQVELVAPPRRMGATNTVEQEVTSLDVTLLGANPVRIHNVPWRGGSAFPLRLSPLARFEGKPYDKPFVDELAKAIGKYREFCTANSVTAVEPEQASESFSPDESRLALLACADHKPVMCMVALKDETAPRLIPLGDEVKLNCATAQDTATDPNDPAGNSRFATSWKAETHVAVEREVFDSENDSSHRETAYLADLEGKLTKVESKITPAPKRTPEPQVEEPKESPTPAPTATPPAAKKSATETTHTKPLLKVTQRANRVEGDEPPARIAPAEPMQIATPVATPVPTKRPGMLNRLLPGRSRPAPTPPPTAPAEADKTPSE